MKKWFLALMVVFIMTGGILYDANLSYGRFGSQNKWEGGSHRIREDARDIIHRSAMVLIDARRAVERRHRSVGFALAMANQRFARRLFFEGSYQEAIFHSLRARQIGIKIIRNNHGRIRSEFYHNSIEEYYARNIPRDEDLDQRAHYKDLEKDDDAVRVHINFDIGD